jgi:biopolymer transport protein ExbD
MAMTSGGVAEGEPMLDINTTPLIDVMLVLLIMLIITIPIQTHAVKLDLPVDQQDQPKPPVDPVKNKVIISKSGHVYWNDEPVNLVRLRQYLNITTTMNPVPELHLQPEPDARYELVDEVLAVTKRANITKMGFVGNEAYSEF